METQRKRTALPLRAQVAMLLAFATLPVGVLAVAQGYSQYRDTMSLRRAALAANALDASLQERGAITEAFGALVALDAQLEIDDSPDACNRMMKAYVQNATKASFAGYVSADGVIRCGHPLPEPLVVRDTPEYISFTADPRRTVTAYEKGQVSGMPVLVASAPVKRNGTVVGALAVSVPSTYLNWVSLQENTTNARFAIIGSNGDRVAGTVLSREMDWLPGSEDLRVLMATKRNTMVMSSQSGNDRIYALTPLFERDVFSVSSWPEAVVTGGGTWRQILAILLPLFMWSFAVMVAYYAVDRFALRHVVYLDRLVTAYTRSRRSLRATGIRDAPFEFAKLGKSFDTMAEEIETREHALQDSLREKDVLLKEVYHRVKNNLQLISSLINLQIRNTEERTGAADGLLRLQNRVHGLAAVHQKLSESGDMNAVRIDTLIEEIVETTISACDDAVCAPSITFDLALHTEGPDRALPIALFVTEAIANAFQHINRDQKICWLAITMQRNDGEIGIEIANGCDGNRYREEAVEAGLGSQLIEGFARQLRGGVEKTVLPDRYILRLAFPGGNGIS